jgi:hypothetical protein
MLSGMGGLVRILEGRFGRLVLIDLAAGESCAAQADPVILMQSVGDDLLFLNPGESYHRQQPRASWCCMLRATGCGELPGGVRRVRAAAFRPGARGNHPAHPAPRPTRWRWKC